MQNFIVSSDDCNTWKRLVEGMVGLPGRVGVEFLPTHFECHPSENIEMTAILTLKEVRERSLEGLPGRVGVGVLPNTR